MFTDNSTFSSNSKWSKLFQTKNNLIIFLIISLIIISLIITTIIFAVLWNHSKSDSTNDYTYSLEKQIIGFPPIFPNDGKYIQWTLLHLNDVYEMLPLDQGKKGGLARVARVRQLLLQENPHTFTILSGDFLSPSAIGQSIVNGTALNGRQMVSSLNTLGLDFVTFGNHEFDLNETELIARMNESKFKWISSNVFEIGTNKSFSISVPYYILTIDQIKILLIGLTIETGEKYVHIINETELITFVQQFVQSLSNIKYDLLIAITHLDLSIDIQLAENIPQIDFILGGHEHEDYYLLRGQNYIPITKADANAFTVYIHRCVFYLDTKQFNVYHTLTQITPQIEDEPLTDQITNYWYNLGMEGFEQMGFQPNETVSCLPSNIELDGRSSSVRYFPTLLTNDSCQSLLQSTSINGTTIGIYNSGSIRIDDVLTGNITQYDILRVLPFGDYLFSLSIPGKYLANVLTNSILMQGSGSYPIFCGINTPDQGNTWLVNETDISKSGFNYNVGTITYLVNTLFNDSTIIILESFNITQTQSFINYLEIKYPPC